MPRNGGYGFKENPQGPVEHVVPVLAVRGEDGRLLAVLLGYACPVQVIRFGTDFSLIGLSGETVVDYALRLRKECAAERLGNGHQAKVFSECVIAHDGAGPRRMYNANVSASSLLPSDVPRRR